MQAAVSRMSTFIKPKKGGGRDDHDDEDVEAVIFRNLWKNHRLLPPKSPKKVYWDAMMFVFVLYNSIYIPINIAFNLDKPLGQCIVDLMIDILFLSDMALNFRTTYYDDENELVLDKKAITRKYLCSSWFAIDLVAVFPFDIIAGGGLTCGSSAANANQDTTTVIKLLKALRLLRLVRFRKEIDRLSGAAALRVAVALFIFLLVAHWLACVWWAVGSYEFYADGGFNTTLVNCDRSKPCSWFRRTPEGNLKLSPDRSAVPLGQQYISSLYWSLTTLMKTPWIGPDTVFEKVVLFVTLLVSAIVNAYFLSTVQGSYTSYNKQASQKRDKITALKSFMSHYSFPAELRAKLVAYTHAHSAAIPAGLNNVNVLMQLPSHLRNNVTIELYAEQCGGPSVLFPKVSVEAAKALVARLNTTLLIPNQLLIAKGEVCQHLYFLFRGSLRVTLDPPREKSDEPPEDDGPPIKRNSSRKSMTSGFKIIEKPGSRIGLIEPVDGSGLGIYPVYVSAGPKTVLLLSVSRAALAQSLDGFGEDIPLLRETLVKDHKVIMDSLKVPDAAGSPLAVHEKAKKKSENDKRVVVQEDAQPRIRALESSVQDILQSMISIQQNMEALPQILQMLQNESKDGEGDAASAE